MSRISSNSQREFFKSGVTLSVAYRIEKLRLLLKILQDHEAAILNCLQHDLNKPEFEAIAAELQPLYTEIELAIRKLPKWAKLQKKKSDWWKASQFLSTNAVQYEPFGVCLVIAPWNYPFQLALSPVVAALAAGNCVTLKPSEISSASSKLISQMISKVFPSELIQVVEGGAEITTELLSERWDFIFFTGSTEVGRIVQQAAAPHLTPTLLELGGRCPVFFSESADFEVGVKRLLWSKCVNAGQTCVAPNHVFIPRSRKEEFISLSKNFLKDFYPNDNFEGFSKIISQKHFDRLASALNGQSVLWGGNSNKETLQIEPTLIEEPDPSSDLATKEIFGPILPLYFYDHFEDLIQAQQKEERPLCIYYFGRSSFERNELLNRTSSGFFVTNDCLVQFANSNIPAGGVGASGMGKYHGAYGFQSLSHAKGIQLRKTCFDFSLRYPPYPTKTPRWLRRFF